MNWAELRQLMIRYLSDEDVRSLCFDLGVDYDSFGGEGKDAKVRELIIWCGRNDRVPDLVAALREMRPQVTWQEPEDSFVAGMTDRDRQGLAETERGRQAPKSDSFTVSASVGDVGAGSQIAIGRDIVQSHAAPSDDLEGLLQGLRQAIEMETAGTKQSTVLKQYADLKAEVESPEPDLEQLRERKSSLEKLGGQIAARVEQLFKSDAMKEIVARAAEIAVRANINHLTGSS